MFTCPSLVHLQNTRVFCLSCSSLIAVTLTLSWADLPSIAMCIFFNAVAITCHTRHVFVVDPLPSRCIQKVQAIMLNAATLDYMSPTTAYVLVVRPPARRKNGKYCQSSWTTPSQVGNQVVMTRTIPWRPTHWAKRKATRDLVRREWSRIM